MLNSTGQVLPKIIISQSGQCGLSSPQTNTPIKLVTCVRTPPTPFERWIIDSSRGPTGVIIRNSGNGFFLYADGGQVVTKNPTSLPLDKFFWEIRTLGPNNFLVVPGRNLALTFVNGQIALTSVTPSFNPGQMWLFR
ncbi:hypothetical protein FBU30_008825 [Linnemannia zychae]|nr:hypothetical protein FBU30_008825 [Linnemannia zychae]